MDENKYQYQYQFSSSSPMPPLNTRLFPGSSLEPMVNPTTQASRP
jgi:hypothetical protein